jgi:hypothetical protein
VIGNGGSESAYAVGKSFIKSCGSKNASSGRVAENNKGVSVSIYTTQAVTLVGRLRNVMLKIVV